MKKLLVLLFVALISIPCAVSADENAQDKPFQGYIKSVKYHARYDVNADGTNTQTIEEVYEVLREEGISSANQEDLAYSESMTEIVILEAYTVKKDGTRLNVSKENIQERAGLASGGPMYSDIKVKVIIFPNVGIGDRTVLSYKIINKETLFPGHFSVAETFRRSLIHDDVRVVLSVPEGSLKINVFSDGVKGGKAKSKNGRKEWTWTYKNDKIEKPETGAVVSFKYVPRIMATTFNDFGEIGTAYEKRASPKAATTDQVKKLAEEITKGIADRRKQAETIYGWISKNLKYAGNCVGVGSVVPHDIPMILENKLGDCKDHALLYQALLKAKGIESTFVLISSGYMYDLPDLPVAATFNHVLNYIPEFDIYADATSKFTPFGMLSFGEYGKSVIHTAENTGLKRTPQVDYKKNNTRTSMSIKIAKDGSAEAENKISVEGVSVVTFRGMMAYLNPNLEEDMVSRNLSGYGYKGSGKLVKDDPWELKDGYSFGFTYKIGNFLDVPGTNGMEIRPLFDGVPLRTVASGMDLEERKKEFLCSGGVIENIYSIELPSNVKILSMPKDAVLEAGKVKYEAVYKQDGNKITINRKYSDATVSAPCSPDMYKDYRAVAFFVLKDLRSKILYESE